MMILISLKPQSRGSFHLTHMDLIGYEINSQNQSMRLIQWCARKSKNLSFIIMLLLTGDYYATSRMEFPNNYKSNRFWSAGCMRCIRNLIHNDGGCPQIIRNYRTVFRRMDFPHNWHCDLPIRIDSLLWESIK